MPLRLPAIDARERVRETAFALLLDTHRPVAPDELGVAIGGGNLAALVDALVDAGWVDRAADGRITGSAGLSLSDGPHRLTLGGRDFRTWCAYDALGIPAALSVNAEVTTDCGVCGKEIVVSVDQGEPRGAGPERLWMAAGSGDLRTSFCTPTVLLCSADHGDKWAREHAGAGELLSVEDAAKRGASDWATCADMARRIGTTVEYVGGPRDTERARLAETPERVDGQGGYYQRSVRCADDGALRFVWRPSSAESSR